MKLDFNAQTQEEKNLKHGGEAIKDSEDGSQSSSNSDETSGIGTDSDFEEINDSEFNDTFEDQNEGDDSPDAKLKFATAVSDVQSGKNS